MAGPPLFEFDDPGRGRLSVAAGETVVLLGPSGAGKTRLIRSLLALPAPGEQWLEPLAGLRVRGQPALPEAVAALAGWVPDGDGVFLSDTVGDNVARPPGVAPYDPATARDVLDLVGLGDRADDPVSALGWGGRRRVALARALASRRPLLVVDGELDPTIWPLLPALLEQAAWVEALLLALTSMEAVAPFEGGRPLVIARVEDGRVIAP